MSTTRIFALYVLLPVLIGCLAERTERSGVVPAASAQSLISDAVHGDGTRGFFFLPPLVPPPAPAGAFDASLAPSVRIDRVDPATGRVLATLTTFVSGTGSDAVRAGSDHYVVNWNTDASGAEVGRTYRVTVLVSGRELGFVDVAIAASQGEAKNLATAETVALVDGRTLPIKFRIEQGAQCGPFGAARVAVAGVPGATVLRGTIVTPDEVIEGEVLVEGDTITCVAASCAAAAAYATATIVDTGGVILPGLIDTHNHVPFNVFDETDWSPAQLYENRDQWPLEPEYDAMRAAKRHLNGEVDPLVNLSCELDKHAEARALVAGTTSIVNASVPANRPCFASLARTIDQAQNGLGADRVFTQTFLPSTSSANQTCAAFASGSTEAYLIHVAEGVDQASRDEFHALGSVTTVAGCLYAPQTAIVHGVALGDAEFGVMADAGMSLIWSPRSNMVLYGATADVPRAQDEGINLVLGADWTLTGSQNLLDELRFADQVDAEQWGDQLSAEMLVRMVTSHAAAALGLGDVLGSIAVGYKADLMVVGGDRCAPYDALLAARPADVRLVMVGGEILYGDPALEGVAPGVPGCEPLSVCGTPKFLCAAAPSLGPDDKLDQTLAEIEGALSAALSEYDQAHAPAPPFSPIAPLVKCE